MIWIFLYLFFTKKLAKQAEHLQDLSPVDTGRKLNIHKTFRRYSSILQSVLFQVFRRIYFTSWNTWSWRRRRKLKVDFISKPHLQIRFKHFGKCLNLCLRKWLRLTQLYDKSNSFVIIIMKEFTCVGSNKFEETFFEKHQNFLSFEG